ncbi:unnamed protein product [Urochloa humidicola]
MKLVEEDDQNKKYYPLLLQVSCRKRRCCCSLMTASAQENKLNEGWDVAAVDLDLDPGGWRSKNGITRKHSFKTRVPRTPFPLVLFGESIQGQGARRRWGIGEAIEACSTSSSACRSSSSTIRGRTGGR